MKNLHIRIILILIVSGIIAVWVFSSMSIESSSLKKAKRLNSDFGKGCSILRINSEAMNKVEELSSLYSEGSLEDTAYCFVKNVNLAAGIEVCGGMSVTVSDNRVSDIGEITGCEQLEQLGLI